MKKFIPTSGAGIFLTVLLLGIGAYLGYEHRKKEGFWWGALAAVLVLAIIVVSQLDVPSVASAPIVATPSAPVITPATPAPASSLSATPPAI